MKAYVSPPWPRYDPGFVRAGRSYGHSCSGCAVRSCGCVGVWRAWRAWRGWACVAWGLPAGRGAAVGVMCGVRGAVWVCVAQFGACLQVGGDVLDHQAEAIVD
eukprot:4895336-Prymnesium_polylepis.1